METARSLIGKQLCTCFDEILTAGIITEAEAYRGADDRACHAYQRRTPRTEVMYGPPGHAYVYLCYGLHTLFNIVTSPSGEANAVLIRAIVPTQGVETILERRHKSAFSKDLCRGPGKVTQALGIELKDSGCSLLSSRIWIEDVGIAALEIRACKRIGIDYAGPCRDRLWRFAAEIPHHVLESHSRGLGASALSNSIQEKLERS